MTQTLIGVIFDAVTLAPRRVIHPHADSHLYDGRHKLNPGEKMVTIKTNEWTRDSIRALGRTNLVRVGHEKELNATELAYAVIRHYAGREPPSMDQVHAMDRALEFLHVVVTYESLAKKLLRSTSIVGR